MRDLRFLQIPYYRFAYRLAKRLMASYHRKA